MNKRTFEILGFDKIIEIIAAKTQTVFGKELSQHIRPKTSVSELENEFELLEECLGITQEINFSSICDLRTELSLNNTDVVLPSLRLRDALKTLIALRTIREFFSKNREKYPKLYNITKNLNVNEQIEKAISTAIDEFGEIKSDASPILKKIRNEITKKRKLIINKLDKIIQNKSKYLQNDIFVIRHNRFCLPLKTEAQKKIPGILHEFSTAGKTIFLEPIELVDDQNDFARSLDEEKNEIHRILACLSNQLMAIRNELFTSFAIIGTLDLFFAKRSFALQYNCTRPIIATNRELSIVKGCHPLLQQTKTEIVPLDLTFPSDCRIILISGPNAGGKTVVMKTVGLFVLMFLSGIFLPVQTGTKIPFFTKIFADIGDEQSLDSNLSSFSAHIMRVKEILENADDNSLILLDEIGSSTAPDEGSALAIAVLETLRDKNTYCIATSHLNPIKMFVKDAPGMINASMEYHNRPTYRFTIGFPGTSSAFEIAKELGFPDSLLKRAKTFLNQDWLNLSDKLNALTRELETNKLLNKQLETEKNALTKIRTDYESKLNRFRIFENDERKKILVEKRNFLLEQRRNIENLIRSIKESNAQKESIVNAKLYCQNQIDKIDENVMTKPPVENKLAYQAGDVVFSKTFQKIGTIVDTNKYYVTVAFGSIKFELTSDDLDRVENFTDKTAYEFQEVNNDIDSYFKPTLNIRGMNKEEALIKLQQFLNHADDNNLNEVMIIHGKGKGILKGMLWDVLQKDPRVSQLRIGESYEGGDGVTKIILKQK